MVYTKTEVVFKECLYRLLSQKMREAVKNRMVIEDVV